MITLLKSREPGRENVCKKCGCALLRGFTTLCLCMAAVAHPEAHPHREAYTPKPMTEIVTMATTTSTAAPPIRLNGQTYHFN